MFVQSCLQIVYRILAPLSRFASNSKVLNMLRQCSIIGCRSNCVARRHSDDSKVAVFRFQLHTAPPPQYTTRQQERLQFRHDYEQCRVQAAALVPSPPPSSPPRRPDPQALLPFATELDDTNESIDLSTDCEDELLAGDAVEPQN